MNRISSSVAKDHHTANAVKPGTGQPVQRPQTNVGMKSTVQREPSANGARPVSIASGLLCVAASLWCDQILQGQTGYAVEVATATDATLTSIDSQAAINDAGWIAFCGVESGQGKAFALDPFNARTVVATGAANATFTGAAINDQTPPETAYRILIPGPFTYVHRAVVGGSSVLVGRSPNDFDSATSFIHLNDSGVVAFPGLTQGSTRLVLFSGSARPPVQHASFPFAFGFRPEISNDGRIVIREPAGDIVAIAQASSVREVIAPMGTWSLTGNMPGISRDGRAIAFVGNRGLGKAVFLAVRDVGGWSIHHVVGESGTGSFSDINDAVRVGVTSSGDPSTEQRVSVVYYAQVSGIWGAYASDIVVTTNSGQRTTVRSKPSRIVRVGDTLSGRTVASLNFGHPINSDGDVVLWFSHVGGSGILRARRKVRSDRESMRLRSASAVLTAPDHWQLTLEMDNDNGDDSLQSREPDWRRWWHCEIEVFNSIAGETLDIDVTNPGYADDIVPAWSLSIDGGRTYQPYERVPAGSISGPTYSPPTNTHRMSIVTPAGVTNIRLAKFLPYTVREKDEWLARIAGQPRLAITTLPATSEEGRPIHLLEITDRSMPADGKRRVWIHAGTHPAETTSYFTVEGLVAFLLSGSPAVEDLLDKVIFNVVPMQNPDGVFHGNYRTNVLSRNLEEQWALPDSQKSREVLAVKQQIEAFMGTAPSLGIAPLMILLNLHSAHGVPYPFHFEHTVNPNAGPSNPNGVRPEVAQLEAAWVAAFRSASPFLARGSSQFSSASRAVIEGWIHDAYSIAGPWSSVMAITCEGTYQRGPNGVALVTANDYRGLGAEMGRALLAYVGRGTVTRWGRACEGAVLTGSISSGNLMLSASGLAPSTAGLLVFGLQRIDIPLPLPSVCTLGTTLDVTLGFSADSNGRWSLTAPLQANFCAALQVVAIEPRGQLRLVTTNGLNLFFRR